MTKTVHTKCTKFAFISTAHFFKRTPVCDLTVCRGRFAQTNIGWTSFHRKPQFRIQTVALTKTTTNYCSVLTVLETWHWWNQIDGHAWNDNDWHRRRRLYVACKAQPFVKHFVSSFHYSPHLSEFTTVVSQSLTPTNKHHVDLGNSIIWTSHGLDSYVLPQVQICSRLTKRLGMVADLPLEPSWMFVDNHGSRSTQKSINTWWWQYVPLPEHATHGGYQDIPIVLLDLARCTDTHVQYISLLAEVLDYQISISVAPIHSGTRVFTM